VLGFCAPQSGSTMRSSRGPELAESTVGADRTRHVAVMRGAHHDNR
jgi:hypothetical protein